MQIAVDVMQLEEVERYVDRLEDVTLGRGRRSSLVPRRRVPVDGLGVRDELLLNSVDQRVEVRLVLYHDLVVILEHPPVGVHVDRGGGRPLPFVFSFLVTDVGPAEEHDREVVRQLADGISDERFEN